MISFLSNWIESITIAIIIVSIIELVLPKGNLQKYIKVVLGIYVIFSMISPFVDSFSLYDISKIDIEEYDGNITKNTVNQTSMDTRLEELYIEQLEDDISSRVEEYGYILNKCSIDADLNTSSQTPGIHEIELWLSKNDSLSNTSIDKVEEIEIGDEQLSDEFQNNRRRYARICRFVRKLMYNL